MALINFADLFMDTDHADIIFVVENMEIPGHRIILAKTCPYFDKLLYGGFKESKSNRVEISGTAAKLFKEVIRFIYLGQLNIVDWKIEDLLGLLSLSHEYQLQPLILKVTKALEQQSLDFDSWSLIHSAAAIYDSQSLRTKCASFVENKMNDFLRFKELERFSPEFICLMFETANVATCNQDQLLRALCKWKTSQSTADIMSVFTKICWEKVSPTITAIIVKELLYKLKNVDDCEFWTKLAPVVNGSQKYLARVKNVVLLQNQELQFPVRNYRCNLFGCLYQDRILWWFNNFKYDFQVPVKSVEFKSANYYSIDEIYATTKENKRVDMLLSEPTVNSNNVVKYSATFPSPVQVCKLRIFFKQFCNESVVILRELVIR